ncbi:MAG: xanthine dehydrogenase family protein molybdopterin-binding subunit, partial [Deltaproteobacteria bacterium]
MHSYSTIGKPEKRADAIDKVTGQAQYANDIKLSGMMYAKVKRSEVAHGKILHIDTSEAEKHPEVRAVIAGEEFSRRYDNPLWGTPLTDQPLLAVDRVRYVGEPVAAVAADTEEAAELAVELIQVNYEQLPTLCNAEDATKPDATLIHEKLHHYKHSSTVSPIKDTNICDHIKLS